MSFLCFLSCEGILRRHYQSFSLDRRPYTKMHDDAILTQTTHMTSTIENYILSAHHLSNQMHCVDECMLSRPAHVTMRSVGIECTCSNLDFTPWAINLANRDDCSICRYFTYAHDTWLSLFYSKMTFLSLISTKAFIIHNLIIYNFVVFGVQVCSGSWRL